MGHVAIGRKVTGAKDPIMLYVSGGNTQVISHYNGRYRVMGETMDIGLGNLLDKLGRDLGYPFPGGPQIEKLALQGKKLLELPYSVKGMDTSFSGIYTAAREHLRKGNSREDVCLSVQEYSFAMLLEVLERGLHQTSKNEILLAGGVAKNLRLREMISELASDLGIKAHLTADQYCMDNGAMIAQGGLLMYENGYRMGLEDSTIDQRFRIDQVEAPWIPESGKSIPEYRGAESIVNFTDYHGRETITKMRIPKAYRNAELDNIIRMSRLRNELSIILKGKELGIPFPNVYDVDSVNYSTTYERISGRTLRGYIKQENGPDNIMDAIGGFVGRMHTAGITHGDLTVANILVNKYGKPFFIDTSMGKADSEIEDMAVDLYLFYESLKAVSSNPDLEISHFRTGYQSEFNRWSEVFETVADLELRRRYV